VTPYLAACFKQAAGILSTAGVTPWLQFGEFLWWFFSVVQNLAVGYASWTSPISIGTVTPHGLSTGQRAILAGIQGNTAANGDQTITVTDTTHFTLNGSSGSGNYVAGTGTCSGGGMAYYDAYTAQAANTALGRSLAAFYTQDDDPTVNGLVLGIVLMLSTAATVILLGQLAIMGGPYELVALAPLLMSIVMAVYGIRMASWDAAPKISKVVAELDREIDAMKAKLDSRTQ
jgi:hypothetical protein